MSLLMILNKQNKLVDYSLIQDARLDNTYDANRINIGIINQTLVKVRVNFIYNGIKSRYSITFTNDVNSSVTGIVRNIISQIEITLVSSLVVVMWQLLS